jgi:hypothetical protein
MMGALAPFSYLVCNNIFVIPRHGGRQWTHKPKIDGSNPATRTGREKTVKKLKISKIA